MKPKKAKPVKAVKAVQKAAKKVKEKKPKPPSLGRLVFDSIMDTLENTVLSDGEFDLPSILTRQLDKSHPDFKLGLHREYYIPTYNPPYYLKGQSRIKDLFNNQATIILPAIMGEGIKLKKEELDYPMCKACR